MLLLHRIWKGEGLFNWSVGCKFWSRKFMTICLWPEFCEIYIVSCRPKGDVGGRKGMQGACKGMQGGRKGVARGSQGGHKGVAKGDGVPMYIFGQGRSGEYAWTMSPPRQLAPRWAFISLFSYFGTHSPFVITKLTWLYAINPWLYTMNPWLYAMNPWFYAMNPWLYAISPWLYAMNPWLYAINRCSELANQVSWLDARCPILPALLSLTSSRTLSLTSPARQSCWRPKQGGYRLSSDNAINQYRTNPEGWA